MVYSNNRSACDFEIDKFLGISLNASYVGLVLHVPVVSGVGLVKRCCSAFDNQFSFEEHIFPSGLIFVTVKISYLKCWQRGQKGKGVVVGITLIA